MPGVDHPLECRGSPKPADKVYAFIGPNIFDAQQRLEHFLLKHAHIERRDRIDWGRSARRVRQTIPAAFQVHAYLGLFLRRGRGRVGDDEALGQGAQEFACRHAVQVFNRPIVGQYLKLIRGEQGCEEEIVLFFSVARVLRSEFLASAACTRSAVVAICYVNERHCLKSFDQKIGIGRAYPPYNVGDAVRGEIVKRFLLLCANSKIVDLVPAAIGQKHRAGLRAKRQHVTGAIIFLVFACALVLSNYIRIVFIYRAAGSDSGLNMIAHTKAIDVKARSFFDEQRCFGLELFEVLGGFAIDCIGVNVYAVRQVDLWPRDVQKAERIPGGKLASLVSINDVIRHCRYRLRFCRCWAKRSKSANGCHISILPCNREPNVSSVSRAFRNARARMVGCQLRTSSFIIQLLLGAQAHLPELLKRL